MPAGAGQRFISGARRAIGGETITIDGIRIDKADRVTSYFLVKMFLHACPRMTGSTISSSFLTISPSEKHSRTSWSSAKKQTELYVNLMGHDVNNMNQIAIGFLKLAEDKIRQEGRLLEDDRFLI